MSQTLDPLDFCRWLQGFAELSPESPSPEQWDSIKRHLQLVFVKTTDAAPGTPPAVSKDVLEAWEKAQREWQENDVFAPKWPGTQPKWIPPAGDWPPPRFVC